MHMILWILAALAAYFIKGLCGFANTLVFTSVMSFGADNVNISPVELLVSFPPNLILAWKYRRKLKASVCLPLMALVLAGCIPGALLLKNMDAGHLKAFFGFAVILVGLEMLLREYGKLNWKPSRLMLGIIGLISGVLSGIFGIGALLAVYVGRVTQGSGEFKANLSAVFIAENVFRIILYSVLGVLTWPVLKQALLLLPFMLAGLFAGIRLGEVMNERIIKLIVIILLMISGAVTAATNLL